MSAAELFKNAGKEAGTTVWKVEKFDLVQVPTSAYGSFYTGDSYVVLHTRGQPGKLHYDVFFWLGAETTQDEAASSAYFATQLDDALGGAPVQHRETQGSESDAFLQLFPRVQYLAGGTPSGFKVVAPTIKEPKLFQITAANKDIARMKEVAVAASSLDETDVFVMDAGEVVYVWQGVGANQKEKFKAAQVAHQLRDGSPARVVVLTSDEKTGEEAEEFYKMLG